nr:PTS sugar transporter subunit IIA [Sneathiella glossodoripedis]
MEIADIVSPEAVFTDIKATSKKQVLQELSRRAAAHINCDEREILNVLIERERLGTTGVGQGIAIPHGKLESLKTVQGFFAKLETAVDYDSMDDMPWISSSFFWHRLKAERIISKPSRVSQGLSAMLNAVSEFAALKIRMRSLPF